MQDGLGLLGSGMAQGAATDLQMGDQLRRINIDRMSQGQPPISMEQFKQMQQQRPAPQQRPSQPGGFDRILRLLQI